MKRKRWSTQQNNKLDVLFKKYKKEALSNAQVSRKLTMDLPDRTPTAILTKINRVYGDKTSTVLRKKLGTMTLEQKEKLLTMLTASKQLPSPPHTIVQPITTISKIKKKTPTPPRRPPTPIPTTSIEKEMTDYLTTGKDPNLKKMIKRMLKLKKAPTPPKTPKKPTDKVVERAEKILGRSLVARPRAIPVPHTQGIEQQLEQEFLSQQVTPGQKFQIHYEKVFKEKPSDVVARVVEGAKKRTMRGMKGLEKLLDIYKEMKQKGHNDKDIENMLYMEMRSMLQKHTQQQEKKMKKEGQELMAKHFEERMAILKNIPAEHLKRTMKAIEKEEALREKKQHERTKILQSELSPATKKALLDVLDMPVAPKTAFKPIQYVRQDSDSDDDSSDDDGDVRRPTTNKKKNTKVAMKMMV